MTANDFLRGMGLGEMPVEKACEHSEADLRYRIVNDDFMCRCGAVLSSEVLYGRHRRERDKPTPSVDIPDGASEWTHGDGSVTVVPPRRFMLSGGGAYQDEPIQSPTPNDAPFTDLIQRHGQALLNASASYFRGPATDALIEQVRPFQEQYDAHDVHRVDLQPIKRSIACERCGHLCGMTFRDVQTADGFRVLTCPVCEGGELHHSADATGEP